VDGRQASVEFNCSICGNCCLLDIPVTIPDLHAIAVDQEITDEEAFDRFVRVELTPKSRSLQLKKEASGLCVFLAPDKRCSVYENRPSICRFFRCTWDSKKIMKQLACGSAPQQVIQRFARHVNATRLTEEYTAQNGSRWNEADYFKTLEAYQTSVE
jgi:Fe-S-cluster containining protein